MTDEQALTILSENVGELTERSRRAQKQREICLRELIDRSLGHIEATEGEQLYRQTCDRLPNATAADRAMLCAVMARLPRAAALLPRRGYTAGAEGTAPGAHGRVAMVRNRYNEQAFSIFSEAITGAKRSYASSFAEACEDVYDNRCEFCVLPLENETDGRLFGFYAMLDRYELRVCAVCTLESEERSGAVLYALAGRGLPDRLPKGLLWNLEYSVTTENGVFPTELVQVAPLFGATLLKLDSLPVEYDDGMQRFYLRFRLSWEMAAAMELYVYTEHARYTAIGIYPAMESNR